MPSRRRARSRRPLPRAYNPGSGESRRDGARPGVLTVRPSTCTMSDKYVVGCPTSELGKGPTATAPWLCAHLQTQRGNRGRTVRKTSITTRGAGIAGAAILALAVAGFGVSQSSSASSPRKASTATAAASKSLTWGITSLDASLDPGLVYAIDPNVITAAMCNSLLQFGPQGQLEPELASSWKQTSPTTYVYNLVHDARFWDGNPVTATERRLFDQPDRQSETCVSAPQPPPDGERQERRRQRTVAGDDPSQRRESDCPGPAGHSGRPGRREELRREVRPRLRDHTCEEHVQRPVPPRSVRQGSADRSACGAELLGQGRTAKDPVDHFSTGQ